MPVNKALRNYETLQINAGNGIIIMAVAIQTRSQSKPR
jgi:hypothetical protein